MKKFIVALFGSLFACGIVLYAIYHIVNELPPEGISYNLQAVAIFEDAACEKCHCCNSEIFDIRETLQRLKKDTLIGEAALAKIESATVTNRTMPPKTYYLTHWGTAINSAKRKLLEGWIAHQRNHYNSLFVSGQFENEPVRPLQTPKNTDNGKAELGRKLFFDNKLSADNSVSCNTCHNLETGGVDNRQYSQGANKILTETNTPAIYNVGFNFRQFHDGRAADLYSQLADHLLDPSIMANISIAEIIERLRDDKNLESEFKRNYPAGLTSSTVFESIVEFEKTLTTPESRFDKYLQGNSQSLNEAEIIGYKLFKSKKCATCHVGAIFGGQSIEKLSIYGDYYKDRGWQMNNKDKSKFKTPGLRNVALTKPYFHDGSRQTLYDAVKSMGKYQSGIRLSDEETKAIVLFLKSLSE